MNQYYSVRGEGFGGGSCLRGIAKLSLAFVLLFSPLAMAQPKTVPTTQPLPELIAQATAAWKAHDLARAAALLDAARTKAEFTALRIPPELILAVGDYHLVQGTKAEQDLALDTYSTAADVRLAEAEAGFVDAQVRVRRSTVFGVQGRYEQARSELASIRRNHPRDRRALLMADLGDADLQLLQNQADAARDGLAALVEVDDPIITPMALFSLGRAQIQLKQNDQAITTFRKLWNRYGESEWVKQAVYLVGQIYFDRGDFLEARKLYEAVSVVGATMQVKVRPGDDLIVKVADANYYAKTRDEHLVVTLTAPSGDKETLKLDKNRVNDQLYVGRIPTALAMPTPGDGTLQVAGSDVVEMAYAGMSEKPYKVTIVDDGQINIDSVEIAPPPSRRERSMPKAVRKPANEAAAEIVPMAKRTGGALNPGSPIFVQIVDADLDLSDRADGVMADLVVTSAGVAGGKSAAASTLTVRLTETGPRTGVFVATVPTALPAAGISASSSDLGHPAFFAIDVDKDTPSPATAPSTQPASKAVTFWRGKPGEKAYWLEVDLHQPAALGKLTWGVGSDPIAIRNAPSAFRVIVRGDGVDRTIAVKAEAKQPIGNVIDLGGAFARTLRIEFDKFDGEAPAMGQLILTDTSGQQLLPTGIDPESASRQGVLEFDVGQQVSARYLDEKNETPGQPIVRESRKLGVRYYDGALSLAKAAGDEGKDAQLHVAWRVEMDGHQQIVLNDPDLDVTDKPDKVKATVETEAGDRKELELVETGNSTGIFAAPLSFSNDKGALANKNQIYLRPGDVLWMTYLDERNMKPGYRTHRHAFVLENRPTAGAFEAQSLTTTAKPYEFDISGEAEARLARARWAKGG